jgi:hypothetical protein
MMGENQMSEEPLAEDASADDEPYQTTFNAAEQAAKVAAVIKTIGMVAGGLILLAVLFFAGRALLSNVGKIAWQQPKLGGEGSATLLYADDSQIVGFFAGTLAGVNAVDGSVTWSETVGDQGDGYYGRPVIHKTATGFLVSAGESIRCIGSDGTTKWTVGDGNSMVLATADSVVVYSSETTVERQLTAQEQAALAQAMKGLSAEDREKFMLGQRQLGLGLDNSTVVHVVDAATGTERWQAKVPADRELVGAVTDGTNVYMLTSKWTDTGEAAWLAAIAATERKAVWQQKLDYVPDWGPVLLKTRIGIADPEAEKATLFAPDTGTREGSAQHDPWAAMRPEDDGQSPRINASANTVAAYHNGNEQWSVRFNGGVIDWAATSSVVASLGYPEGGLSNSDFGAAAQNLGIDGGALGGMMAQSIGNEVTELKAVKRTHGDVLWQSDTLSGDLVAANDRLVILQDTAKTSRLTVGTGKGGKLIVHQLKPASGNTVGKREHDGFSIDEARIVGDLLIGIAYERAEENPKCLGLIALHLK